MVRLAIPEERKSINYHMTSLVRVCLTFCRWNHTKVIFAFLEL